MQSFLIIVQFFRIFTLQYWRMCKHKMPYLAFWNLKIPSGHQPWWRPGPPTALAKYHRLCLLDFRLRAPMVAAARGYLPWILKIEIIRMKNNVFVRLLVGRMGCGDREHGSTSQPVPLAVFSLFLSPVSFFIFYYTIFMKLHQQKWYIIKA